MVMYDKMGLITFHNLVINKTFLVGLGIFWALMKCKSWAVIFLRVITIRSTSSCFAVFAIYTFALYLLRYILGGWSNSDSFLFEFWAGGSRVTVFCLTLYCCSFILLGMNAFMSTVLFFFFFYIYSSYRDYDVICALSSWPDHP